MRILRTLLVLLLCAMLPLSGLAASGLTGQCPMQTDTAVQSHVQPAGMADCKSTMSMPGEHGKAKGSLCKMTAQCGIGSLYHPVSLPTLSQPVGTFSPVRFQYIESLSIREPDGLWRPPRSL